MRVERVYARGHIHEAREGKIKATLNEAFVV
jgi:hypothetical protein